MKNYTFLLSVIIWSSASFAGVHGKFLPKTFWAKVEQIRKSVISNRERKSSGVIEYQYPGMIRFEISSPDKVLFVSNEKKSWYYRPPFIDGEAGEVTIHNSRKMILIKLLDSLQYGLRKNKFFNTSKIGKKELLITFKNKFQKEMGVIQTSFYFKNNLPSKLEKIRFDQASSIRIIDNSKKEITFNLIDVRKKVVFPEGHFNFVVPTNTKVNQ